jgi:transposase-like protein
MKRPIRTIACKLCGSKNTVRFGYYRGIQRWWCKDCQHKFADNDARQGMKTPRNQVAEAVNMYFEGIRLNSIPRLIFRKYGSFITNASVYNWVVNFTKMAIHETSAAEVKVGDTWIITLSALRYDIVGVEKTIIDIIDLNTQFLLSTRLSDTLSNADFDASLKVARAKARKMPGAVLTDGWNDLLHGIDFSHHEGQAVQFIAIDRNKDMLAIVPWYHTSGDRNKIIRNLKRTERLQLMLNGWMVHYNYFRPQKTLEGRTPAELAQANPQYSTWLEIVRRDKSRPIIPTEYGVPPEANT